MDLLERDCWESIENNIPTWFQNFKLMIIKILESEEPDKNFKIMTLNDILRVTGVWWKILITNWIQQLREDIQKQVILNVRSFKGFTNDNDPYWEHDFWNVTVGGENIFFKTSYYDENSEHGSEHPDNPSVTNRVMNIMLAEEY